MRRKMRRCTPQRKTATKRPLRFFASGQHDPHQGHIELFPKVVDQMLE
jgi:hypothetical protein